MPVFRKRPPSHAPGMVHRPFTNFSVVRDRLVAAGEATGTDGHGAQQPPAPAQSHQRRWQDVSAAASATPRPDLVVTDYTGDLMPTSKLRVAIGVMSAALVVVVIAGALALRTSTVSVIATTSVPAVIDAQPGGTGVVELPAGKRFALSTGKLSVTTPLQIRAVDVVTGTSVKAGSPVVEFDPAPLVARVTDISNQLEQAQSRLRQSRQALERLPQATSFIAQRLSIEGEVTTEANEAAADYQLLLIAKGASPTLKSPIDGIIGTISVSPGETVSSDKILVEILDPSTIQVSSSIPLADLAVVAVGNAVTITFPDLPATTLSGTLVAVSSIASASGQSGTVIVAAPNNPTTPVPIKARAFVSVHAPRQAAVSVARLAVVNATSDPAVYVITRGRVQRMRVSVGAQDDNRIEILAGLGAGQQVALTGTQTLADGERVHVAKVQQ